MRIARLRRILAFASIAAASGGSALQAEPLRPLDDVVAELLARNCIRLRAGDPPTVFEGELKTLCSHFFSSVPPVSAASGGGAATPGSASRLIQQLLRGGDLAASGDAPWFQLGSRLSAFVLGGGGWLDRNHTDFEDAYDSNLHQAVLGASYDVLPGLLVGLAFDYAHEDGRYDSGGDFDTDQVGGVAFVRVQPHPRVALDISAGYARQDRERTRLAVYEEPDPDVPLERRGLVGADYGADVYSLALSLAGSWSYGPVTLAPLADLALRHTEYDAYSESGDTGLELRFEEDDQTSLLSSLGLGATTVISLGAVSLLPQLEFSWLHEFEDDQRSLEASFVDDPRPDRLTFSFGTDQPDRNFFRLGGGLTAALPNGLQPFVRAETIIGHELYDSYFVTVGLSFRL